MGAPGVSSARSDEGVGTITADDGAAAGGFQADVVAFMVPYLLFTLLIGVFVGRNVNTVKGYVLAGRQLPFVVTLSSMFAMFFGAEATLGASYNVAVTGLSGDVVADPYGGALCLILYGLFYAYPLYKTDNLTLSDFYVERYGPKFGVYTAFVNCVAYLMWTGGQIKALGLVSHRTLGIDQGLGSVICTAIITIYTFRGGMVAVAYTEAFESLVIIVSFIIVCAQVGSSTGTSFLDAYRAYDERMEPNWGTDEAGAPYTWIQSVMNFIALWFYIGIGSLPSQDIYERMNAASSPRNAAFAGVMAGLVYVGVAQMPLYLGMVVRKEYYLERCGDMMGCEGVSLADEDEGIVLDIMRRHTSSGVMVVFYAAFTSAILSTASGTLLGAGVLISVNMIRPAYPDMDDARLLRLTRMMTMVFALTAWAFTYIMDHISDFVNLASVVLLCGLFLPLTAGLWWSRATSVGATMSSVGGVLTYSLAYSLSKTTEAGHNSNGYQLGMLDCTWYALTVGLMLLVAGSLMPKDRQDRIDAKMEELLGGFTIFQGRAKAVIKVGEVSEEAEREREEDRAPGRGRSVPMRDLSSGNVVKMIASRVPAVLSPRPPPPTEPDGDSRGLLSAQEEEASPAGSPDFGPKRGGAG